MSHPLFGPEVRLMLDEDDPTQIQAFCETLHPATVAEALEGEFSAEDVWKFLSHTSFKTQATIFEYFPVEWQVKMVEGSGQAQAARLIEKMSHDDRADLLRRLRPQVAENLLRLVDEADRRDIATLRAQKPNTAGALMTTDYAWVPGNITMAEAFDRLRLQAPDSETIYYVFVLDDQRKLQGVMTLRKMVLAARQALVRNVMEKNVVSVKPDEDQENVAQIMQRYDLIALPVVEDDGRLIGIVTHDDVIDVVVKEATEDAYHMGAVSDIGENYLEANFFKIWWKRSMWLSCLFGAELLAFTAMAQFDDAIKRVVVLAMFVPLCISTGGNSGSQAATLITRAMALGHISIGQWMKVLWHELLMGLALGISLGCIAFVRGAFTPHHLLGEQVTWLQIALVLSQAVMAICLYGTLVGSMLPLVFRRLGFDPAYASSPFVATFVDVTGIIIYFTIATFWIPNIGPPTFQQDHELVVSLQGKEVVLPAFDKKESLLVEANAKGGTIEVFAFLTKNQPQVEKHLAGEPLFFGQTASQLTFDVPPHESITVFVRSLTPQPTKAKIRITN